MSNTNTEVLSTAYEKLQGAITQSNTVLPKLEEAVEKGNLDNYATVSSLEEKAKQVDLEVQKSRIDLLTKIESSQTEGNTELLDIRVGADGVEYDTAGGAIRGQIGNINSNITNIFDELELPVPIKLTFEIGGIHANGNVNLNNKYSLVSNKFSLKSDKFTVINSSNISTVGISLVKYYNDGTFKKIGAYYDEKVVLDNDAKEYRILLTNGTELSDTTLEQYFTFYDGEMNSRIEGIETSISELRTSSDTLELSNNYYLLKGDTIKIPYSSFINAELKSEYRNLRSSGYWYTHQFKDYFIYKGQKEDGYIDFTLYNDNLTQIVSNKRLNLKVANTTNINPATSKNLMILGDSFIQSGGIVDVIVDKFNELGLTNINFVGSYTDTDTGSGNRYEGHGGYRALDFISNPSDLRPEFPRNPFWNPTTSKVDFKYYCDNVINVSGLDYVYIHLGVNDKLSDGLIGDTGNNTIVDRLVTLVGYIHASYPNCKIMIDGLVHISEDARYKNYYYYREDIFNYNGKLEIALSNIENVYYVPSILNFNSKYAYKFENEKVYDNSDETIKVVNEWLHPSLVGYKMIADMFIPAFIYNCLM